MDPNKHAIQITTENSQHQRSSFSEKTVMHSSNDPNMLSHQKHSEIFFEQN